MDLTEIRKKIDDTDSKILPLLVDRMKLSLEVAQYKKEHNMPVLNVEREQEILDKILKQGGDYGRALQSVYSSVMEASRSLQHNFLNGGSELRNVIEKSLKEKGVAVKREKVACQGVEGAFSSQASRKVFDEPDIIYYSQFEDVFRAVSDGEAEYGVVPIENSSAGSVHETFDLMMKYRLFISEAVDLSVNHCLLVKPETDVKEVKKVYSHPQALSQCSDYIKEHNLTPIPYRNTAAAAKFVSETDENAAAVASEEAAEIFGLQIAARQIQSSKFNKTRFLVLSRKLTIDENAEKISLIFSLPHVPGSLCNVLSRFFRCGLNLTKIESRPIKDSDFQYYFYLDFTGNVRNSDTLNLLCELSEELPAFTFLGNYREQI